MQNALGRSQEAQFWYIVEDFLFLKLVWTFISNSKQFLRQKVWSTTWFCRPRIGTVGIYGLIDPLKFSTLPKFKSFSSKMSRINKFWHFWAFLLSFRGFLTDSDSEHILVNWPLAILTIFFIKWEELTSSASFEPWF